MSLVSRRPRRRVGCSNPTSRTYVASACRGSLRSTIPAIRFKARSLKFKGLSLTAAPTGGKNFGDLLLRLCGIPRIQYLSRVGLPGEYEQALMYFDERAQEAARRQAGLGMEAHPEVLRQQSPPFATLGLPSVLTTKRFPFLLSRVLLRKLLPISSGCAHRDYRPFLQRLLSTSCLLLESELIRKRQ